MGNSAMGETPDSIEQTGKSGGDADAFGGDANADSYASAGRNASADAMSDAMGGDANSGIGGDASDNTSIGTININS